MRDIKRVGNYEATVHFFKDVEVKLPVTVVAENQPQPVQEEETTSQEESVQESFAAEEEEFLEAREEEAEAEQK